METLSPTGPIAPRVMPRVGSRSHLNAALPGNGIAGRTASRPDSRILARHASTPGIFSAAVVPFRLPSHVAAESVHSSAPVAASNHDRLASAVESGHLTQTARQVFADCDRDSAGYLTWNSGQIRDFIGKAFGLLSLPVPPEQQVYQLYCALDQNRSTMLDMSECIQLIDLLVCACFGIPPRHAKRVSARSPPKRTNLAQDVPVTVLPFSAGSGHPAATLGTRPQPLDCLSPMSCAVPASPESWPANFTAAPPVTRGIMGYKGVYQVNIAKFADVWRPLAVANGHLREKVVKALESGSLAAAALQNFKQIDKNVSGALKWNTGECCDFVRATLHQYCLELPTERQIYELYTVFDTDQKAKLEAYECLCLVDALMRILFYHDVSADFIRLRARTAIATMMENRVQFVFAARLATMLFQWRHVVDMQARRAAQAVWRKGASARFQEFSDRWNRCAAKESMAVVLWAWKSAMASGSRKLQTSAAFELTFEVWRKQLLWDAFAEWKSQRKIRNDLAGRLRSGLELVLRLREGDSAQSVAASFFEEWRRAAQISQLERQVKLSRLDCRKLKHKTLHGTAILPVIIEHWKACIVDSKFGALRSQLRRAREEVQQVHSAGLLGAVLDRWQFAVRSREQTMESALRKQQSIVPELWMAFQGWRQLRNQGRTQRKLSSAVHLASQHGDCRMVTSAATAIIAQWRILCSASSTGTVTTSKISYAPSRNCLVAALAFSSWRSSTTAARVGLLHLQLEVAEVEVCHLQTSGLLAEVMYRWRCLRDMRADTCMQAQPHRTQLGSAGSGADLVIRHWSNKALAALLAQVLSCWLQWVCSKVKTLQMQEALRHVIAKIWDCSRVSLLRAALSAWRMRNGIRDAHCGVSGAKDSILLSRERCVHMVNLAIVWARWCQVSTRRMCATEIIKRDRKILRLDEEVRALCSLQSTQSEEEGTCQGLLLLAFAMAQWVALLAARRSAVCREQLEAVGTEAESLQEANIALEVKLQMTFAQLDHVMGMMLKELRSKEELTGELRHYTFRAQHELPPSVVPPPGRNASGVGPEHYDLAAAPEHYVLSPPHPPQSDAVVEALRRRAQEVDNDDSDATSGLPEQASWRYPSSQIMGVDGGPRQGMQCVSAMEQIPLAGFSGEQPLHPGPASASLVQWMSADCPSEGTALHTGSACDIAATYSNSGSRHVQGTVSPLSTVSTIVNETTSTQSTHNVAMAKMQDAHDAHGGVPQQ